MPAMLPENEVPDRLGRIRALSVRPHVLVEDLAEHAIELGTLGRTGI
jgi:hypothetical protein